MKKLYKNIFVILLSIAILLSGSLLYIHKNIPKPTNEKVQLREYILYADEENIILLNKVKALQEYAESYISETGSTLTATELCFQYIRKDRYSTGLWETLLGENDSTFITYVTNKDISLTFDEDDILIDEKSSKKIDFIHMIAVLNTYYKNGTSIQMISTDYAGWAGDLMTLLEETVNYRTTNSITDTNELAQYVEHRLGTNAESTFPSEDALANFDAINISNISTLETDLYTTLKNYYIENDSTTANNSANRFKTVQKTLGDKTNVTTTATTLLSNQIIQQALIPTSYSNVTNSDIAILAQAFADYTYEKPYIHMITPQTETIVGDIYTIDLVEKHTTNATLTYDENLIIAEFDGFAVSVLPLNYGTASITLTSADGSTSDTFSMSIKNEPPAITKNLTFNEDLVVNVSKNISIEAEGTNNIYTWYLSDTANGELKKLTETSTPTLNINPTIDMNGKYLRCGIKNEGNTEVISSAVQLKVVDKGIVNTYDTTPIIAGLIIILVIIANIIQIITSKYTQKQS